MKYESVFISDVHLGTANSQPEKLIDFLEKNTFNKIYLVGDIIDMLMMKRKFYWKKKHNKVIRLLLKLSKNTEVIYIVGNHDIFLEPFVDESFGGVLVKERDVHITKKGKRCLIIHGHQFDGALMTYTWIYWIGSLAYDFSLWISRVVNRFRNLFGLRYWSLSLYLKSKTKSAIKFINNFENLVSSYAKKEDADVVIAGHIHMKEDKEIDGIRYMNCGCWTEFTSCIVETTEGDLNVIDV